jgi:NTP pyrophosphatase (non-canonical NTP hydrolase)
MDEKRLKVIMDKALEFNHIRGWHPTPQDIAKSVVIEAAELLEHFQWDGGKNPPEESKLAGKDLLEIKYEVADVFWYLINFCNETGIDLAEALELKYAHNEEKYPAKKIVEQSNNDYYFSQKKKYRQIKKQK